MNAHNGRYILNEQHAVVPCEDLFEWARWFEDDRSRRVRLTRVGPYFVSTVFLGLDHGFWFIGPPLVFETMVWVEREHEIHIPAVPEAGIEARTFKHNQDFLEIQERCCTWEEALAQHQAVIEQIREGSDDIEEIKEDAVFSAEWLEQHVK